jgi:hypothetical protein
MIAPRSALVLGLVACALGAGATGCDKLGLGKKDADGGTASGGGGGLFSFLDKNFEGEVTMNVSGKGMGSGSGGAAAKPKTLVFELKSPKVRIDAGSDLEAGNPMLAQGAAFIVDPPAKKAYALIIAQKKAIVFDFDKAKGGLKVPKLGGGAPSAAPSGAPSDPPKIEKTGKTEIVAGYQCEVWKITSKTGRADACLAEGIKWIDLTDIGLQSPEFAAVAAVSDFNHFPLRMVAFDEKNVETSRMEATKIEKKKLDDSRFAVPPDYQVVDLAALLGGFQPSAGVGSGRRPPGLPPGVPAFVPPQQTKR